MQIYDSIGIGLYAAGYHLFEATGCPRDTQTKFQYM